MSNIRSVDNSHGSDGRTRHFVTVENPDGTKTQIEVGEGEASRFQKQLKEGGNGRRLLTETDPYSA